LILDTSVEDIFFVREQDILIISEESIFEKFR